MARDKFSILLTCSHCGAAGAATWEENTAVSSKGPQRRLLDVQGDFHAEPGRLSSGDPAIVCNICDTIQD